jgi:hypothetical protein
MYEELASTLQFTMGDISNDFGVKFAPKSRIPAAYKWGIIPEKVTRTDPAFDKLERARRDLVRESSSMGSDSQMGEDMGARQFASEEDARRHGAVQSLPSIHGSLVSKTQLQYQQLLAEYERVDCERVEIAGKIRDTAIAVTAVAWKAAERIEMVVRFDNFPDTTEEFLYQLTGFSACDSLKAVVLSNHAVIFASTNTRYTVGRTELVLKPGVNVVATLGFHANFARLVTTDAPGKKLLLHGYVPDPEDDDPLTLVTAPLVTVKTGTLTLENAYVRVTTLTTEMAEEDDSGPLSETHVELVGTKDLGKTKRTVSAKMPLDHQLLQLSLFQGEKESVISPADADAWMGGDAWRKVVDQRMPLPKFMTVMGYHHETLLPTGAVTSIALAVDPGVWRLQFREGVKLALKECQLRFIVGLPGTPATTNVYALVECKLQVTNNDGGLIVKAAFDAQVSFQPEFKVVGSGVADQLAITTLCQVLGLQGPPQGNLDDLVRPYVCQFTVTPHGNTVTCIGATGTRCIWLR